MRYESDDAAPRITRTDFELRPRDGGPPLKGDVRVAGESRPTSAVVIVHGFKGFRRFGAWSAMAKALALRGHVAVTIDFSHNGIGDGDQFDRLDLFRESTHTRELDELLGVVDALAGGELTGRKVRKVGLIGHSRGGGTSILAAAEHPRVRALVTLASIAAIDARWKPEEVAAWRRGEDVIVPNSRTKVGMPLGPGYWADAVANRDRLDIVAAAARVTVPWLIVHGDADDTVPLSEAQALFEAAGDNAELLVIDGGDHTLGQKHPYPGASETLRVVADAAFEWLDEALL